MSIEVLMPALSPTMEEGTLAKWLVKVGDAVKSGDVIAEIETDKATMEVEAVDEGVVDALLVDEGAEEIKVNTPIARLKGEAASASSPPPASRQAPSSTPEPAGPPKGAEGAGAQRRPPSPAAPTLSTGGQERLRSPPPQKDGDRETGQGATPAERIFASPLARRLAAQLHLDLAAIRGSGPHGRIVRKDVESAGSARDAAPGPAAAARRTPAPAEPAPRQVVPLEEMGIAPGSYDLVPLDGMRKTVARRMSAAFREVPHFPLSVDIEVDALLAARARINGLLEKDGVKASVNDLIIKAAAAALMRVPQANASYTPEGIALHHHADIAVAVAVEGGLITPIVRAAETKGVGQIAREMKDLAERARSRKLKPEQFQGGTFSVSNLGMFGIRSFASILNEPQGAILSVGAADKRPVVHGDALAIATVMSITLTCDHRALDGAIGSRFLAAFKAMIEDPITLIV